MNEVFASFRDVPFPLNVYACAIFLEEGTVDYLHFGLFRDEQLSFRSAQQYSTDFILSRLPPPPCRILEVGVGLGTTFSLLTGRGYKVHGITPDPRQVDKARERAGVDAALYCLGLEDYRCEPDSYEVLLFQESAQYVDPLLILGKAQESLVPSGNLLILDEFALRRDQAGEEGLHLLDDFIALAGRFGFEVVEQLNLSSLAAPTLDYMLHVTSVHRQSLLAVLGLRPEQLDELDAANMACREKYAAGRFGYVFLNLKKNSSPQWKLRGIEEAHVPEIQGLYEQVFGQPLSTDMWRWKYAAGRGCGVGVWREEQLVGHYGGVRREIMLRGKPHTAVQIGDVMADARERGGMARKGPFFLAAATFVERHVGFGKKFLFSFGFPNDRAMRVASHLKLYKEVDRISLVSWPAITTRPSLTTMVRDLDGADVGLVRQKVDSLWAAMRDDLKEDIVGIRDWEYISHRYLCHPRQRYHVMLISRRLTGAPVGLFVARPDNDRLLLLDVIGTLGNLATMIHQARRLAGALGLRDLYAWITKSHVNAFMRCGATANETDICVPMTVWGTGPTVEEIRDRWWLTAGDADFQ